MKRLLLPYLVAAMAFLSQPVFSQADIDTTLLGLPGDNLDLYAVLSLFQKSKTIEAFEKSLNEQKTGINNLDLDLDKKADFIKVVTKKKDSSFSFILQVDVKKDETQDVAVILVDKGKDKKVTIQIVGDEALYGKNYIVEPKPGGTPAVTANPAYVGSDPVPVSVPATTTIVVEQAPIVQYVYSPAYVPYAPPYYYGYYPPYFAAFTIMAVGIYRHNNWYHHGGYHGSYYHGGNNVVINNNNNFNNYNNNKQRSNTVNDNMQRGNYGDGNRGNNGNRGGANRPSTGAGASGAARPSTQPSNRSGSGLSSSARSNSNFSSPSTTSGGRNMGGGAGGGGRMRGGGGGGGRRR